MPTIGLFLIFNFDETRFLWIPSSEMQLFLYVVTCVTTFLLPLLNAFTLFKMKYISSFEMKTKEERKIPYLFSAVFYSSESYFLMHCDVPVLIKALMLGAALLVVSVLLINLFWKISAHMVGIGGLFGMIIAISSRLEVNLLDIIILLILISGIVGWARLQLSAHSQAQVYIGFLLGVLVEWQLFSPYPIPFLPAQG